MAVVGNHRLWAHLSYTAAFVVLWIGVIASIYLRGSNKAFWIGFSICGLATVYTEGMANGSYFATHLVADFLREHVAPVELQTNDVSFLYPPIDYFRSLFHSLFSLAFAFVGGFIARYFYWLRQKQEAGVASQPR